MEKTRESDLDEVRRWIVEALDDAKAANILELDIRPLTQIADWMVVASGTSTRHVLALAARLREAGVRHGLKPTGVEGENGGEWVLLDFGDLMILGMAFPNVLGLYFLAGGVKKDLDAYMTKLKKGEFEKTQ